ncbi:ATP-binding cassette domain-containing protein [Winogradskyella luteola]|uniref:Autoinducer 2 import ATP-binding protein LsrA n=1 Tax=Winogradskyella luteola TaxID=2828330 RepID=A0A9X1JPR6_9FLAO|nr:ATP-binding cassette domain-containing protein [Winogradskyella luteola]MBV7270701.1 sugar ABC transporter ATP-binding protein [Winogradskyella luteola]
MVKSTDTILNIKNVSKNYDTNQVLDNVSMSFSKGEIVSLYGPNGAGKSTLVKIICGEENADSGEVMLNDNITNFKSYSDALAAGISYVPQEGGLMENLTVLENLAICLKNNLKIKNFNKKAIRSLIAEKHYFESLASLLDVNVVLISAYEQQLATIFKALMMDSEIFIFDESTTNLNPTDFVKFKEILIDLKKGGKAIIFISHKLDEVFDISDTVTILKEGKVISSNKIQEITKLEILNLFKSKLEVDLHKETNNLTPLCEIQILKAELNQSEFYLSKGEVLCIDSNDTVFKYQMGYSIYEELNKVKGLKVGLIPALRDSEGIFPNLSVEDNLLLNVINQSKFRKSTKKDEALNNIVTELKLKFENWRQNILELSGGNRQKVILGRWMLTDFDVLVLIEPTAGIDIESKTIIHNLILKLRKDGKSFVLITSDQGEQEMLTTRFVSFKNDFKEVC